MSPTVHAMSQGLSPYQILYSWTCPTNDRIESDRKHRSTTVTNFIGLGPRDKGSARGVTPFALLTMFEHDSKG